MGTTKEGRGLEKADLWGKEGEALSSQDSRLKLGGLEQVGLGLSTLPRSRGGVEHPRGQALLMLPSYVAIGKRIHLSESVSSFTRWSFPCGAI